MANKNKKNSGLGGIEGILGGLSDLVQKLGDLAEKGEQLSRTGEIRFEGGDKDLKGVFGFSVKTGLGGKGVKVEPFGNIRKDKSSGQAIVEEIREPVIDVFDEGDHTRVVAEMPGIGVEDVQLDVKDDVMTLYAEQGKKKYRKEVLLPRSYPREKMTISCNNGIVEIRCSP